MQACDLENRDCIPCRGGIPPLKGDELEALHRELGDTWQVVAEHHLERRYAFPDFKSALSFTNAVGELAEDIGHHPDITLRWGEVAITLWTHKADGLVEADFIVAARIESLYTQTGE